MIGIQRGTSAFMFPAESDDGHFRVKFICLRNGTIVVIAYFRTFYHLRKTHYIGGGHQRELAANKVENSKLQKRHTYLEVGASAFEVEEKLLALSRSVGPGEPPPDAYLAAWAAVVVVSTSPFHKLSNIALQLSEYGSACHAGSSSRLFERSAANRL